MVTSFTPVHLPVIFPSNLFPVLITTPPDATVRITSEAGTLRYAQPTLCRTFRREKGV